MLNRKMLMSASAIALTVSATPCLAQATAAAATSSASAPDASVPGDIIVTAQRRSERLQDVPISITALSDKDLDRLHANDVSRVEFATPGFTWGSQGSDSFPAIRGVRTSLVSAQNDPVIGFYIDGIYQSRTQQQSIPLFDIGRVEVQRGPQGTLYGRNTFGGNLSIVTQEPIDKFAAGLNLDFGNFASKRIDGFVNVPLTDTLQVRVAGVYQKHDGYVRSTHPGVRLDDDDENAQRVNLKWKPDSNLDISIHAGHWQRDDAGAGSYGYKVAGTLINPANGFQSINGQPFHVNPSAPNGSPNVGGRDVGVPVTGGAWTNDWDYQPFEHIKENYVSGQIAYDFGFATLRSITGYTKFSANRSADNDQSSVVFEGLGYGSGVQNPDTHDKTFTQEVQLASDSTTPFQWIVGAYYLHDSIFEIYQQKITAPGNNVPGYKETTQLHTNAIAGYAQGYYYLVPDKLRLIAGVRYSHEKKAFNFADYADGVPGTYDFTTPYSQTSGSPSFNSWTWRAGIEYTPTRTTTLYFTASTGFESGGVNDTGGDPTIPSSYAPQKVNAYEVGAKNRFLDGKVQTEVSLFWNDFSNLQINVYTPLVSYFGSAGQARSRGAEAAVRTQFLPGLHVDGTIAYMDAKYTRYISANNFAGASGGFDPPSVDLAGKRIPQSPKIKTTVAVYYDMDLHGHGTLSPSVNWLHSGRYYTTDYNTPLDLQKAYNKVDVALRWTAPSDKYYIEGYGENITNVPVLYSAVVGRLERVQVSYGPPATYGVRLGVKF
jgi:iron complex outermembrane receptor protein